MDIKKEKRKLLVSILNSSKISRVISGNYSYRYRSGIHFNETLFTAYAGFEISDNIPFEAIKMTIEVKLGVTREILSGLADFFKNDTLIYKAIFEKISYIKLVLLSLPFELEKAGWNNPEAEHIQFQRKKDIEAIESELYGESVCANKQEREMCYAYLIKKYERNKNILSPQEDDLFTRYIQIIEHSLDLDKTYSFRTIWKEALSMHFFKNFGNTMIPREQYIALFQKALFASGMRDWTIGVWNGGTVCLTKNTLLIPESSSYNQLSLERILRLISHEIMVHGITWKNQKRFFGSIKGASYILKEEGLASYMEARLLGENPKSIKLQPMNHTRILAGEILEGEDFKTFIEIYRKLTKQSTSSLKKSLQRHKVHHSFTLTGTSRKDTQYIRGIKRVKKYLQEGGDIQSLFCGKINFEDTEIYKDEILANERFVSPVPISEYIVYHLSKSKKYASFTEYLEKKYPDMYTLFRNIDTLYPEKHGALEEMLNIIKKYTHG